MSPESARGVGVGLTAYPNLQTAPSAKRERPAGEGPGYRYIRIFNP